MSHKENITGLEQFMSQLNNGDLKSIRQNIEWLESLEIKPQMSDTLVEQIKVLEDAFRDLTITRCAHRAKAVFMTLEILCTEYS